MFFSMARKGPLFLSRVLVCGSLLPESSRPCVRTVACVAGREQEPHLAPRLCLVPLRLCLGQSDSRMRLWVQVLILALPWVGYGTSLNLCEHL